MDIQPVEFWMAVAALVGGMWALRRITMMEGTMATHEELDAAIEAVIAAVAVEADQVHEVIEALKAKLAEFDAEVDFSEEIAKLEAVKESIANIVE